MSGFINAPKQLEGFASKAESFLYGMYPSRIDSGMVQRVHIGRNTDSAPNAGSWRVTGQNARTHGNYMELPDRIIPDSMIQNFQAKGPIIKDRITDSAANAIQEMKEHLIRDCGMKANEAEQRICDSAEVQVITHFDDKEGVFIREPIVRRVNDSMLAGLATPYWNTSFTNKIFKQPFIEGIARNLVDTWGVPNAWADFLVMFAETFEGMARVSNVARSNVEINDAASVSNRMEQIVSMFYNIVVDYETGMQEDIMAGQSGNPLGGVAIGDREKYARLMIEQLYNAMILFGVPEAGFNGLSQIATVESYSGTPFNTIWAGTSATKGADMVEALLTIIGNMQENLSFLPTSVRINVSPTMYKCLKYAMQSKVYNPTNPLRILQDNFYDTEKITGNGFIKGLDFTLVADPFCAAGTPWHTGTTDMTFITFPSVKSALEPMDSLIISPVAIENYILPTIPGREGLTRTMMKRVGDIIAPVNGTIKIIEGMGVQ